MAWVALEKQSDLCCSECHEKIRCRSHEGKNKSDLGHFRLQCEHRVTKKEMISLDEIRKVKKTHTIAWQSGRDSTVCQVQRYYCSGSDAGGLNQNINKIDTKLVSVWDPSYHRKINTLVSDSLLKFYVVFSFCSFSTQEGFCFDLNVCHINTFLRTQGHFC